MGVTDAPTPVVDDGNAGSARRHLPQMVIATTIVAVLPLAASLALRSSGVISSAWLSVGLAVALSLAASSLGSAYWRKRGGHGEVLFSELLLWGWIRSWRQERELANAIRLLALVRQGDAPLRAESIDEALTVERREHLLRQLAEALEGQDIYLNGHSRRVARHATMIARGMGLSSDEVARIRAAAAVHDIGKLQTPKAILNKPGRLTDQEFEVIKRHPVDGAVIVAALGDPELTRIVRHHHERLDGAGYPDRLAGEEIPLGARIIAVADTFDAITSARPYRDAAAHQKAIDILRQEAGAQLDPDAVRAFLAYYSGSRPTVVWAIITSSIRRVVSWLSGDPAAAATISASKVAAATAATAAIGAAAGAAPVPVVHHPPRHAAAAHAVPSLRPGATLTLHGRSGRRGAHVVAASRAAQPAHSAAGTPRHVAHAAAAHRHGRRRVTSQTAHRRARINRAGSTPATTTATPALGRHSVAPSRSGAAGQGPGRSTAPVSHPDPASHSQGSSANGNAYGHTKPLGNGHGHGVAGGHVNPNPLPSASGHGNGSSSAGAHKNSNAGTHKNSNAGTHENSNAGTHVNPNAGAHVNQSAGVPAATPPSSAGSDAAKPSTIPAPSAGSQQGASNSHSIDGNGQGGDNHQGDSGPSNGRASSGHGG